MNKLTACLIKDCKLMISKSFSLIFILIIPLFFMSIILYNFSDILYKKVFMEPFSIIVLDKDNSKYSTLLINQFNELDIFKTIEITNDETTAFKNLEKDYAALIIIPEKFIYFTSIGKNPPISVIGNKSTPFRALLVKNLVQTATNFVISGQSSLNTMYYFNKDLGLTKAQLDSSFKESIYKSFIQVLGRKEVFEAYNDSNQTSVSTFISIVASIITLFIGFCGLPAVKILVEENISKISLRLKSANVGILNSFLSKFLISLLFTAIQISIVYFCATKVFHIDFSFKFFRFLLLIVASVYGFCGFATFIAIISRTQYMADILGNLTLFIMAISSGCLYPTYTLPDAAKAFGQVSLHGKVMDGLIKIFSNSSESILNICTPIIIIGSCFYIFAFFMHKYREVY